MSAGERDLLAAGVAAPEATDRCVVYLAPGQVFAAVEPSVASMILGSCVAVCLWDRQLRAGGANHFLLPDWVGNGAATPRYGNVAIERLIQRMQSFGCRASGLQAKLFGGATVIQAFQGRPDQLGSRNVALARKVLAEAGIPVVAEDVGGSRGRKLVFRTDSGIASVRLI